MDRSERAAAWLEHLCTLDRTVGTPDNRAATAWIAARLSEAGLEPTLPEFPCLHWTDGGATLGAGGRRWPVQSSPFTLGGRWEAPLRVASTREALEALEVSGEILLLRGEIAAEPLMPKGFVFYNPPHHRELVALLEAKAPAAILTATGRHPDLGGGVSPFPMLEDGDLRVPSAFLHEEPGTELAALEGEVVRLDLPCTRAPATGHNAIARVGPASPRVVVTAHVDAKVGTPGALDDAAGVVTLLLLAERLAGWRGAMGVEVAILNGEDHYGAHGEMLYLETTRFEEVALCLNVDNAGYVHGPTAWSLYGVPAALEAALRSALEGRAGFVEGPPWFGGDHGVFMYRGRPAAAFTSLHFQRHPDTLFSHTVEDHPGQVDPHRMVALADALHDALRALSAPSS